MVPGSQVLRNGSEPLPASDDPRFLDLRVGFIVNESLQSQDVWVCGLTPHMKFSCEGLVRVSDQVSLQEDVYGSPQARGYGRNECLQVPVT